MITSSLNEESKETWIEFEKSWISQYRSNPDVGALSDGRWQILKLGFSVSQDDWENSFLSPYVKTKRRESWRWVRNHSLRCWWQSIEFLTTRTIFQAARVRDQEELSEFEKVLVQNCSAISPVSEMEELRIPSEAPPTEHTWHDPWSNYHLSSTAKDTDHTTDVILRNSSPTHSEARASAPTTNGLSSRSFRYSDSLLRENIRQHPARHLSRPQQSTVWPVTCLHEHISEMTPDFTLKAHHPFLTIDVPVVYWEATALMIILDVLILSTSLTIDFCGPCSRVKNAKSKCISLIIVPWAPSKCDVCVPRPRMQ